MSLKKEIDQDLKAAMLAGDKALVVTLRGIKSAILYAEVGAKEREAGLDDQAVSAVLRKELKKRKESAEAYNRAGSADRAAVELVEAKVIEKYLPEEIGDDQLKQFVAQAAEEQGGVTPTTMGRVIARVRELSQGNVDGGRIAAEVKERIEK